MEEMTAPAPAEEISAPQSAPEPQAAPEASPEPSPPPVSRRDAIERALAKVDGKAGDDAPKAQERGADGKFVAKAGEAPEIASPAPKSPLSEAPERFSPDAKAAWAQAPEAVRGEIKRAVAELEGGLRQKDEQLAPLKPFFDMARQHGVNLHDAVGNYVRMEQLLARDPKAGLEDIARNFGMTLEGLIAKAGGGQPQPQPQSQDAKDGEILALRSELQNLRGQVGNVSQTLQEQRHNAILADVERFAADHPRLDELAPDIARMLQTGFAADLADAYDKAALLKPAPIPAPAPQPRPVRSVTGAPSAGSNPAGQAPSKSRSEAIERAMRSSGLM